MPGARLLRRQVRVGDELNCGAQDRAAALVQDDRAVHLRQLTEPGRREIGVQLEAAGTDVTHDLVEAEHDERAGVAAQNPLESVS
jgi:hypothetical protein